MFRKILEWVIRRPLPATVFGVTGLLIGGLVKFLIADGLAKAANSQLVKIFGTIFPNAGISISAWLLSAAVVVVVFLLGAHVGKEIYGTGVETPRVPDGPTNWTITQAVSWVAFGEPNTKEDWNNEALGWLENEQYETPDDVRLAFDEGEAAIFEKAKAGEIEIIGRKKESALYEHIPPIYFNSDLCVHMLHDIITCSGGPSYYDVKVKRKDVLRHWPDGGEATNVARKTPEP